MDDEPQPDLRVKATPFQRAKDTLLNGLEQLQRAEEELGDLEVERVHCIITYEVGAVDPDDDNAWHSIGGWASTPGSKWEHAALLRRAAEAQEDSDRPVAKDDGEDESD